MTSVERFVRKKVPGGFTTLVGGPIVGLGVEGAKSVKKSLSPKPIQFPEEELFAPSPQPIQGRAEDEAKKKVRKRARGKGRQSTIFAGLLNARSAQRNNTSILRTRLG